MPRLPIRPDTQNSVTKVPLCQPCNCEPASQVPGTSPTPSPPPLRPTGAGVGWIRAVVQEGKEKGLGVLPEPQAVPDTSSEGDTTARPGNVEDHSQVASLALKPWFSDFCTHRSYLQGKVLLLLVLLLRRPHLENHCSRRPFVFALTEDR